MSNFIPVPVSKTSKNDFIFEYFSIVPEKCRLFKSSDSKYISTSYHRDNVCMIFSRVSSSKQNKLSFHAVYTRVSTVVTEILSFVVL